MRPKGEKRPEWAEQGEYVPADRDSKLSDTGKEEISASGVVEKTDMADDVIRLTCTLSSMFSLFAVFLIWAEKQQKMISHFSIRSVFLLAVNLISAVIFYAVARLTAPVPFVGLVMNVFCLAGYVIVVISIVLIRFRMMVHAWNGERTNLPVADEWIERTWHV